VLDIQICAIVSGAANCIIMKHVAIARLARAMNYKQLTAETNICNKYLHCTLYIQYFESICSVWLNAMC